LLLSTSRDSSNFNLYSLVDFIRLLDLLHWSVFSQDQIYSFFTGRPTKSNIAGE
jgi:hypothetical protein